MSFDWKQILAMQTGQPQVASVAKTLLESDSRGVRQCEACSVAKYCSRTTAVASTDDFEWHRSVFGGGQPWAISLIWGYTAREKDDWRLYHVNDARLTARTARRMT